jgi:hypothetical protein
MTDPRRDKLVEEIMESFEMPEIIAAAAAMLGHTHGFGEYTMEQLADYVTALDYDGLVTLREMATEVRGKGGLVR